MFAPYHPTASEPNLTVSLWGQKHSVSVQDISQLTLAQFSSIWTVSLCHNLALVWYVLVSFCYLDSLCDCANAVSSFCSTLLLAAVQPGCLSCLTSVSRHTCYMGTNEHLQLVETHLLCISCRACTYCYVCVCNMLFTQTYACCCATLTIYCASII